jgi:hypothetical protein
LSLIEYELVNVVVEWLVGSIMNVQMKNKNNPAKESTFCLWEIWSCALQFTLLEI